VNPLSEVVRMAKETGRFESLVDAIPYLRFLGVTMECVDGKLVGKMSYAEHLIGNAMIPALHGGTIGALLESTAIFETLFQVETNSLPKIVTLTVDYLRSGRPVDTYAAGVITKQGRRVVNVGVEAWQEDRSRPIARANAHFLVDPLEST
jgi:acyl-coenzyme A thioesterase PaaI-like protein